MPKKGGKRKKTRTHVEETQQRLQGQPAVPKSFVFKHGKVPSVVQDLISDFRHVMRPFTASKLKVSRHNGIKDLVKVAAPLGVSHLVFFTASGKGTNMKIARLPRGPTLSFKVTGYSLMKHIHMMQKRPVDPSQTFQTPPLVVLNNFNRVENHIKLMHITFQSMFPAIDVQTIKLGDCRRVVLFNYDAESDQVEFRQYSIRANPLGLSRSVKTILKSKVPNLHKLDDISDFLSHHTTTGGSNYGSDSEMEDETAHVTMPDAFMGRGNARAEKSAIRCSEIGPRMTLKLVKVERETCEGDVLYHAYNTKTPEEAAAAKAKVEAAAALKTSRRLEQESNVEKKQAMKDEKKAAKLARKEARENATDSLLNLSSSEEEEGGEESENEYPEDLSMVIEEEHVPEPENVKTKQVESTSEENQQKAGSSHKKKRKLLVGNAPKQRQAQHLAKKKK